MTDSDAYYILLDEIQLVPKFEEVLNSLLKIEDSFKKIIVIKDDITPWRDDNGILTIGLFDFLMSKENLE